MTQQEEDFLLLAIEKHGSNKFHIPTLGALLGMDETTALAVAVALGDCLEKRQEFAKVLQPGFEAAETIKRRREEERAAKQKAEAAEKKLAKKRSFLEWLRDLTLKDFIIPALLILLAAYVARRGCNEPKDKKSSSPPASVGSQ